MTATRAPQLFTCTCDAKPEPHPAPVQRIMVAGAPGADPQRVHEALWDVRYDLSLFYGPDVVMVVTYQGVETETVKAARDWAAMNGIVEERRGGETVSANLIFINSADRPAWGERRPVDRPTFLYDAA
ncbi:hypothetical protein EES39_38470 [Streptomyces sp. ADI92-24]|uniref:hypothetical protein n=1 Tax=Streptomyces sp. ADI92-24 TaxID=1522756 RepID=UPI000F551AAB|nr:hypothetical protein [Streptomyces sp. ADI92-24]RPK32374.1 hypothetical protein EES39_38470 [Streptomyces sp. ADI92-24]